MTGGSRSGKSRFALERARTLGGPVLFVATGLATDPEMAERIARHRAARPATWKTLEARYDLAAAIQTVWSGERCVLVDEIGTLVANLLVERDADEAAVEREVAALAELAHREGFELIVVSAEVGFGLVPPTPLGRRFRDLVGLANQQLASVADEVVLLVAGIPLWLKR